LDNPKSVTVKPDKSFMNIIELLEQLGNDKGREDFGGEAYQLFWDVHKLEVQKKTESYRKQTGIEFGARAD